MMPYFLQDVVTCDPKGRDCIERSSSEAFHCNTTCAGIYADVQWAKEDPELDLNNEKVDENMEIDLEGKIHEDLIRTLLLLKKDLKNDIADVIKIATGQRGEELDREKYKALVSEYRKFKNKNVKHFRFNSAANMSKFGNIFLKYHHLV